MNQQGSLMPRWTKIRFFGEPQNYLRNQTREERNQRTFKLNNLILMNAKDLAKKGYEKINSGQLVRIRPKFK